MSLPLIQNWQDRYKPRQARVYTLGKQDREVIDKTFDKLHEQGRLRWTLEATPFSFPYFLVWRNKDLDKNSERKGRVVIDIRALNHITMPDAYPIPAQVDILSNIAGC